MSFSAEVTCFSDLEDVNGFRDEVTCFSGEVTGFWEEVDDVATEEGFLSELACSSEGFPEEVHMSDCSVDLSFSVEVTCFSVVEVGFLIEVDVSFEVISLLADFFIEIVDFSWETNGFSAFESCSAPVGRVTGWLSWNSS